MSPRPFATKMKENNKKSYAIPAKQSCRRGQRYSLSDMIFVYFAQ